MKPEQIICPYCNAVNDAENTYCAGCGAELPHSEQFDDFFDDAFDLGAIDGISGEDLSTFIGGKANRILPQFFAISGGRNSWCWPAAIAAIIFGPLGVALWALWRKMIKVAAYFLLISLLSAVLPFLFYAIGEKANPVAVYREQYSILTEETENAETDKDAKEVETTELQVQAINKTTQIFSNRYVDFVGRYGISYATFAVKILSVLVGGLFGYRWYKDFSVRKIRRFRDRNSDPRYYRLGLMRQGSTSGGMVVVGLLIYFAVSTLLMFALIYSFIL